jgi:site-specific DNA recombinase
MTKKAVTYVRVSSKEQAEGFSPEAQKRLLFDFARRNEFDVVQEFEDVETAKKAGRKQFQAMLDYVGERDIKYILVEKTDRLHRNFKDYTFIEDLTEQQGVTVHLVKENTAIGKESKSSEKLMYGMRTLLAKNFIDNLKEEVQKGFQVKLSHGEYPRQAPIGYLNSKDPHNPKHNIITIDPLNRDLITKFLSIMLRVSTQ